jgi:WD40 repeat protein
MLLLKGTKRHVKSVAFSPDGTLLASGAAEGAVRIWDALTGKPLSVLLQFKEEDLTTEFTVLFAPDGRHLVVSSDQSTLSVWDVVEQRLVKELFRSPRYAIPTDIGFAADGRLLAARSDGKNGLWAWDAVTWEELPPVWRVRTGQEFLEVMAVEPDGWRVALGPGQLIDVRTGKEVGRWGPGGPKLTWAKGKSLLAVSDGRKFIDVYDPNSGRRVAQLTCPSKYFEGCVFTPDGRHLLTVSGDGVARMYETDGWTERQAWDWKAGALKSVAVSPDGCRAAAGTGTGTYSGKIVIWDLD